MAGTNNIKSLISKFQTQTPPPEKEVIKPAATAKPTTAKWGSFNESKSKEAPFSDHAPSHDPKSTEKKPQQLPKQTSSSKVTNGGANEESSKPPKAEPKAPEPQPEKPKDDSEADTDDADTDVEEDKDDDAFKFDRAPPSPFATNPAHADANTEHKVRFEKKTPDVYEYPKEPDAADEEQDDEEPTQDPGQSSLHSSGGSLSIGSPPQALPGTPPVTGIKKQKFLIKPTAKGAKKVGGPAATTNTSTKPPASQPSTAKPASANPAANTTAAAAPPQSAANAPCDKCASLKGKVARRKQKVEHLRKQMDDTKMAVAQIIRREKLSIISEDKVLEELLELLSSQKPADEIVATAHKLALELKSYVDERNQELS